MTLTAPTFPLAEADALTHLTDTLGSNYGGPTDQDTLSRALSVDGVTVEAAFHARPWATAARLIVENTEYEVSGGLDPRIDRKIKRLDAKQMQMDAIAGILHLLPSTDEDWAWGQGTGSVPTEATF